MKLNNKRVALDLESTLADITSPFVSEYNQRNGTDIERDWSEWDFSDAPFTAGEFHEITSHNWKHHTADIEPTERRLERKVEVMNDVFGTVDIVTGRRGLDSFLKLWLEMNDIEYDNFIVCQNGQSKSELGYDVFIDDRPSLAEEIYDDQYLLLYDQHYNRHVEERKNVSRIDSLSGGIVLLLVSEMADSYDADETMLQLPLLV